MPDYARRRQDVSARPLSECGEDRAEAKRFYASKRWRRFRAMILNRDPLCVRCLKRGRVTPSEHVHHIRPRRDFPALAWQPSNLEALCEPCHPQAEAEARETHSADKSRCLPTLEDLEARNRP